ncbi:MAG TPA: hypothetical protein VMT54_09855 [Candidatus Cybelea sp.]|nr:hypothetical protein [Candidatus Cybelea sp.]
MRILLFATALLFAFTSAHMASACTQVEHVSATKAEEVFKAQDCLWTSDGRYRLIMQQDGNLRLYDERHAGRYILWTPDIQPQPGSEAVLKNDGSFSVVDPSGKPLWTAPAKAGTATNGDFFITLGDKGRVEIYKGTTLTDPGKTLVWASELDASPDRNGNCQCHVRNTDGSPGRNMQGSFGTCGLTACLSTCGGKKDYFGDPLIGTYNGGDGKCRAF